MSCSFERSIQRVAGINSLFHFGIAVILHERTRHGVNSLQAVLDGGDKSLVCGLVHACDVCAHGACLRRSRAKASELGIAHAHDVVVEVCDGVPGMRGLDVVHILTSVRFSYFLVSYLIDYVLAALDNLLAAGSD